MTEPPLDDAAVRAAVVRPGGLWRSVEVVPVTGSTMGWAPAGERSRMESRRCPSSTPQPRASGAETHVPLASGPRWIMASLMR